MTGEKISIRGLDIFQFYMHMGLKCGFHRLTRRIGIVRRQFGLTMVGHILMSSLNG